MTSFNRFIQFNNEQVDARLLMNYEQLVRALANAPYLKLTERKLMEFNPSDETVSIRFRKRIAQQKLKKRSVNGSIFVIGRILAISCFNLAKLFKKYMNHHLENFSSQLLLLIEEFRLF